MSNALTHYYNLVLSKLNTREDLEIVCVVPKNRKKHSQEGVYQTEAGISFKISELDCYSLGGSFYLYKRISVFIEREKPDVIVVYEQYMNNFLFNIKLRRVVERLGVKIIMKSIPFRLDPYSVAREKIYSGRRKIKSLPLAISSTLNFFGIDKIFYRLLLEYKRIIFNLPHAHVNYVQDAFDIYGSYGVSREKIFITYNSPDTDYLLTIRDGIEQDIPILPPSDYRLIHIGRLVEWKRVDMLIRSVAILKKDIPKLELVIIGMGPQEENLKKLVNTLSLQDSVRFIGGVYEARLMGKYLMASSIYVLAGMGGLSINDAMCFGLPIICSIGDGTEKYLVKEGINGIYFEEGNEVDLVKKISYLLNNQKHMKKMGEASTKIIKNEINIHTVINGYLAAFNYVSS
jgi:glycosyltransferase involved in cell wall biosynthesis